MYCNNCGKEIDNEWKVCPYCGARNENVLTESTPQPTPQMNYGQPVPQMNYNQPMPQPSYNQQYGQPLDFNRDFINPAQPKPKKKSKLPIIITAVVLVVAIVLGAIFIPGLLKSKGEEGENSGGGEPVKNTETVWIISKVRCTNDFHKTTKETTYSYSDDYKTVTYERTDGSCTGTEYFDESGKLIKSEVQYYRSGSLSYDYRYLYSYDNTGRLIKKEDHALTNGNNVKITNYFYNGNGDRFYYDNEEEKSGGYITAFDSEGYIAERDYMVNGEMAGSKYCNIYDYEKDNDGKIVSIVENEGTDTNVWQTYELEYTSIEVSPEEAQFFKAQQKNLIEFNIIL